MLNNKITVTRVLFITSPHGVNILDADEPNHQFVVSGTLAVESG
jgi:hypothetical protein